MSNDVPVTTFDLDLDAISAELAGGGGGSRAVHLQAGNTVLFPLVTPGATVSNFLERVQSVYQGKASNKVAIRAYIASADNHNGYPEGWDSRVVPVVIPKTVLAQFSSLFADWSVSHYDEETGAFMPGTAFRVSRTGQGRDTKYLVSPLPKSPKVPETLEPMAETLKEFADSYTTWQQTKDSANGGSNDNVPSGNSF